MLEARLEHLVDVALIAGAVASVSMTTSRSYIFKSLRRKVAASSEWFGKLVRCPYCTSHWLCFAATLVFRPRVVVMWTPVDLLVSAFLMVTLATIWAGLIRRAFDGMVPADLDDMQTEQGADAEPEVAESGVEAD